jgi:iron complex outermembrane recepter protein
LSGQILPLVKALKWEIQKNSRSGRDFMKTSFKIAALAMTALSPVTAWAQEAPEADEGLEKTEIIITARKTEERLQDSPTSVGVATAASIDRLGLDSIQDVSRTTSGIVFDDSFGRDSNRPVIRGQANILGQSGVAFFIDGIYYSGSIADYDVDTIERIEVVKGPQSALYGRNTYSGAINIISKSPGDKWEGKLVADVSEHSRYEVTANVRGPLADGLGLAIGGRYYDFGGEFTNAFDGTKLGQQESKSLFGMLKYDQGGPIRASLRANFTKTDDGQPAIFSQSANSNNCLPDNGALYLGLGRYYCGTILPRPNDITTDYRRQFVDPENVGLESDTLNAAFRVDYDLTDSLTLTSLTGYNKRTADNKTDGDYSANSFQQVIFAAGAAGPAIGGVPPRTSNFAAFARSTQDFTFSNRQDTDDWSQEVRLDFQGDGLRAMIGGYYFRQNDDSRDTRVVPSGALALAQANANAARVSRCARIATCGSFSPITIATTEAAAIAAAGQPDAGLYRPSRNVNNFDIKNKAIFGSLGFDVSDTISLSFEGRLAKETISQATQTFRLGDTVPVPSTVRASFKEFTPRIVADWKVTPDNLLYFIYGEGQKPGGFNSNQAITAGFPTFDAEDVGSVELGSKNTLFDGRLVVNIALYQNRIEGYQLTQNVSVPPSQTSLIVNAGDAKIRGFELDLAVRPVRGIVVTANYAYTDAKFTRGFDENQGVLNDVADDRLVNCSTGDQFPLTTGCQSLFGSIVGKRIPRAPSHSAFIDVDFRTPIGSGDWNFFAGANVTYRSNSFAQVDNLAGTGDSSVTDLRLGVQNDRFKIQGYVKNVFDENAIAQIIRYADANNDLRRNFIAGLRPGRRFGLILTAGF